MPTFLRVMTSSAVYSSKSPAMLWKSVPAGERTYGHERSLLSCFGVMVWFSMVMRDDYFWKKIFRELHASRNEKVPIASSQCILML